MNNCGCVQMHNSTLQLHLYNVTIISSWSKRFQLCRELLHGALFEGTLPSKGGRKQEFIIGAAYDFDQTCGTGFAVTLSDL